MDERFAKMSKLTLIYANSIDLFNLGHVKFLTRFANEDEQREIVERVKNLLNRPNPMDSGLRFSFDFTKCPGERDREWTSFAIADLDQYRNAFPIPIPLLGSAVSYHDLIMWILGNYR